VGQPRCFLLRTQALPKSFHTHCVNTRVFGVKCISTCSWPGVRDSWLACPDIGVRVHVSGARPRNKHAEKSQAPAIQPRGAHALDHVCIMQECSGCVTACALCECSVVGTFEPSVTVPSQCHARCLLLPIPRRLSPPVRRPRWVPGAQGGHHWLPYQVHMSKTAAW
jgi:hypothetical protein